jgi:hypothetical protein
VWSGSDAALRLRSTPAHRLDLRELHVLATRRLLGLNAPGVWVAHDLLWSNSGTRRPRRRAGPVWAQFGMDEAQGAAAISGWGMNMAAVDPGFPLPVSGAPGLWYRWSIVRQWDRWPRRQEVERTGTAAEPGPLLLFVSHRWEHTDHPDPTGRQLHTLTAGLTVALAAAVALDHPERHRGASGLPELFGRFVAARRGEDWRDDPELQGWAKQVVTAAKRMKSPTELMSTVAPLETRTRPGSWADRRRRVEAMAADSPSVSPRESAMSASSRLPTWAATPVPSAVTTRRGRPLLRFTMEVPFWLGSAGLDNRSFPCQKGLLADLRPLGQAAY